MDEQDHDDRYSGPCYYDIEQGVWVNGQYEPIELPSTRRPLHGELWETIFLFDDPKTKG